MRRFLVGLCCVIVALQVLIGVPLAVCIGFLSLVENDYSAVAVDVQSAGWSEAPPFATTSCGDVCPSTPIISPPPATPLVPNSLVAASPVLSGDKAPDETADEFIAAFKHVAAEATSMPLQGAKLSDLNPIENGVGNTPVRQLGDPSAVVHSLRTTVEHLYALSHTLEADGSYGRADQVRDLARTLRGEIEALSRDRVPPSESPVSVTASPPPTVTEAPYNPEPAAP